MIGGYLGNFIIENIKFRTASIKSILELHRFMEKTGVCVLLNYGIAYSYSYLIYSYIR